MARLSTVRSRALAVMFGWALCTGVGAGCASSVPASPGRIDEQGAERLHGEALAAMDEGQSDRAERLLLDAVARNPRHAAAHNNLGIVLSQKKDYAGAVRELRLAADLAPDSADPLHNVGHVYETIGWLDDAVDAYEAALRCPGESLETVENLARVYLRLGVQPARTKALLQKIILVEQREEWRSWARSKLAELTSREGGTRSD